MDAVLPREALTPERRGREVHNEKLPSKSFGTRATQGLVLPRGVLSPERRGREVLGSSSWITINISTPPPPQNMRQCRKSITFTCFDTLTRPRLRALLREQQCLQRTPPAPQNMRQSRKSTQSARCERPRLRVFLRGQHFIRSHLRHHAIMPSCLRCLPIRTLAAVA